MNITFGTDSEQISLGTETFYSFKTLPKNVNILIATPTTFQYKQQSPTVSASITISDDIIMSYLDKIIAYKPMYINSYI